MDELKAIWASILRELASRKFRAFVAAELTVLLGFLNAELTAEKAISAAVALVVTYLVTIAVEDSASKLAGRAR